MFTYNYTSIYIYVYAHLYEYLSMIHTSDIKSVYIQLFVYTYIYMSNYTYLCYTCTNKISTRTIVTVPNCMYSCFINGLY